MEDIKRQFLYIGEGSSTIAAWLHMPPNRVPSSRLVVIANPLGTEYMSGYRSIRVLADALAEKGNSVLRFDYRVAGDSGGGDFADVEIDDFCDDIRKATDYLQSVQTGAPMVLIGIGLGASFAATVAESLTLSGMVLWNPTFNGRRFVREQKLLSELLNKELGSKESAIDAAGVYLTESLQAQFRSLSVDNVDSARWPKTLIIEREELPLDKSVITALDNRVSELTVLKCQDYSGMMDLPTDSVIPEKSIGAIVRWLEESVGVDKQTELAIGPAESLQLEGLHEQPLRLGSANLFGILCEPENRKERSTDWIFLNCGSEHHAGPHRLYTRIARRLASYGVRSLRFDIEGIGDSISRGNNAENNPYSPVALDDIRTALAYLEQNKGARKFTLIGICAGAYHAFQSTAHIDGHDIDRAILINPLVFEWDYENPGTHFSYEIHTYGGALSDRSRLARLIRGEINYRRLIRAVVRTTAERLKKSGAALLAATGLSEARGTQLAMRLIEERNRKLSLILAENDPGLALLQLQAAGRTRRFLKEQRLIVSDVEHANHGFSKKRMQDKLVDIVEKLANS